MGGILCYRQALTYTYHLVDSITLARHRLGISLLTCLRLWVIARSMHCIFYNAWSDSIQLHPRVRDVNVGFTINERTIFQGVAEELIDRQQPSYIPSSMASSPWSLCNGHSKPVPAVVQPTLRTRSSVGAEVMPDIFRSKTFP